MLKHNLRDWRTICRRSGRPGSPDLWGFSLIELLVVVAIIGILAALLLPAVEATRESARRLQCSNNLKQLSLASLQHVEQHGYFPTGGWGWHWVGDPDRGFDKRQPGGWVYAILPYIEQAALGELSSDGRPAELTKLQMDRANVMVKTPLVVMNCPSRRDSILYPKPVNGAYVARNAAGNSASDNLAARGDYAVNSGSQTPDQFCGGPNTLSAGDSWPNQEDAPGCNPCDGCSMDCGEKNCWKSTQDHTGISYQRSEVRMAHLRDGASNTIMLGEKYLSPDDYATGACGADNESMYTGYNNDNFRSTNAAYRPMQDQPGYASTYHFGSAHWGGCYFAFCDGRVQMVNYTVDPTTYGRLGNRMDGEPVDDAKY